MTRSTFFGRTRPSAIVLAAALVLGTGGDAAWAQAEPADPTLLHAVEGGDPLLLREQPDADAPVVEELPAGTRDLVLSGAAVEVDGAHFVEIVREGRAWADAARLAPQEDEPVASHPLACAGTEPFWSLAIDGEAATFETPDTPSTDWFASEWMPARGVLHRFMIRLGSGYGTGYLALLRQTCSDGMSDIAYPYEAILVTPGQAVRAGCCRRAGSALP